MAYYCHFFHIDRVDPPGMANPNDRFEDNVPGAFYVDYQCIGCGLCAQVAPAFFQESEEGDHHHVHRQPVTEGELELAREALEGCPVEAIGVGNSVSQ